MQLCGSTIELSQRELRTMRETVWEIASEAPRKLGVPGRQLRVAAPVISSGPPSSSSAQYRSAAQRVPYGRRSRGAFDLAVTGNKRQTEWREDRTPAVLAAGLPLDGGTPADAIDLVHQSHARL